MAARAPTLMFCTGATKAGTSWLHRYVSDHPDCHMRAIKELHYFDSVAFDDYDTWIEEAQTRQDQALMRSVKVSGPAKEVQQRMLRDTADWLNLLERRSRDDAAYLAYLETGRTDETLVGDMTPAYALLAENWLKEMAKLTPDVRFVYLLRDPVARLWSHCRMIANRRAADQSEIQPRSVNILKRTHKGKEPEIVRRCDYAGPLKRMRAALDPSQWRVFFYEELFRDETIADLCRFLGISEAKADFGKKIMEGPGAEMEPGQYERAREFLAPQYDYLRETFDRLPAGWDAKPERV